MEDFECDSFYNMDLDLEWDNEDILSSAIQECGLEGFDEVTYVLDYLCFFKILCTLYNNY